LRGRSNQDLFWRKSKWKLKRYWITIPCCRVLCRKKRRNKEKGKEKGRSKKGWRRI
jgi:hypothetical protein